MLRMENARGSPPAAVASRFWYKSLTACSAATSPCRMDSVSTFPHRMAGESRLALDPTSLRAARTGTGSQARPGTRARRHGWRLYKRAAPAGMLRRIP